MDMADISRREHHALWPCQNSELVPERIVESHSRDGFIDEQLIANALDREP
jgi:hypothetical protein